MLIKKAPEIQSSEITDRSLYLRRREFIRLAAAGPVAAAVALGPAQGQGTGSRQLAGVKKGRFATEEAWTLYKDVTTYNNFYEFGVDKDAPSKYAGALRTKPWTVAVEGEIGKPAVYHLEDILRPHALEERVYRHRCVEAWSMVILWVGFPLADLIKRFEPTSRAKFVEFTTLYDPTQMPGQRREVLKWPYAEGLRLDEAMHPLTILAVGLYGGVLPNQNGAPLRLVVPWKYGFKSIKSIVKIRFTEKQPATTWARQAPSEYGFYANVNPNVDHPRWSQGRERRIGEFFKRKTLPLNGYADEVASMYAGMDLRKYF